MKNYKMMLSTAGLLALTHLGCAATSQPVDVVRGDSPDDCTTHNQTMRPQWDALAVRTAPSDVVWRPGMRKTDARQEVVAHTFRPGLRETSVAAASCLEPGPQIY